MSRAARCKTTFLRQRDKGMNPLLSERFIRSIFSQVINGLREVHANKLLHLDLKPANIYLRVDGTPLLLDFGAARQTLKTDMPKLYPMYSRPVLLRPNCM